MRGTGRLKQNDGRRAACARPKKRRTLQSTPHTRREPNSGSLPMIIHWGGWTFLWTPFGIVWLYGAEAGGTPLHEIAGTMTGSLETVSPIAGSSL
jgi:hypothetical protein